MSDKIYLNDVGVLFQVDVGSSLSGATVTDIVVKQPDTTTVTWHGTVNTVNDNIIDYITVDGDLDQLGNHIAYAYVEQGSTSKHSGTVFKFKINDVFT